MSLRRGFKAEANRISLHLRRGLGLAPHDPVNLYKLAEKLGAIVVPLKFFADEYPDAVRHFTEFEPGAFSAATVPLPSGRRVVIYNDNHSDARCNSNIAHELAHLALGHEFTLPIDTTGCRVVDRDIEDEANWLGPTILISNEAALHILKSGMPEGDALRIYGVSSAVLRMRLNASGARIRLERTVH